MRLLRNCCVVLSTMAYMTFNIAMASDTPAKPLHIPNTTLTAEIDGELNDELWQKALEISLDLVNSPWDNQPSPVKTQAKIIENGNFVYISFIAHDPNPEKIIAALADRDSRWNDDLVGIKLDTANNRRLNYSFLVNPFGVQHDQIFNEMTGASNNSWDGIWHSFGKITDSGYQVEMAIPYNALNFEQTDGQKTWAFEFIRIYPRDTTLRISHVALDKNNACWLCQYPELVGFENAKTGKNLTITPSFVAGKNQERDVYAQDTNWQDEKIAEAGLDVRWGIDSNTLLNITLNPDFSAVESDNGQLKVNQLDALFVEEKRSFFLENEEYFKTNFNLIHTRNIYAPDYGGKLTGANGDHTYGIFVTNDSQTSYISPSNKGSEFVTLNEENHGSVLRYRYDYSDDFSVGAINTYRTSDSIKNMVTGLDTKYRFDDSNSILAQFVYSDTKADQLSPGSKGAIILMSNNSIPAFDDTGHAIKIDLVHESEYWELTYNHQEISEGFRADFGFMPKADYRQEKIKIERTFYGEIDSFWSDANIAAKWNLDKSTSGELLEKGYSVSAGFHGPMLSYVDITLDSAEKLSAYVAKNQGITSYFTEQQAEVYAFIQPTNNFYTELSIITGDKIDYANNRLGDYKELWTNSSINITKHLAFNFSYTYSELDEDHTGQFGYVEQIADIRLSYQFDVRSYLKLNVNYYDFEYQPDTSGSYRDKELSTQLIYAYKINPQTVFYLGYSDQSYRNDFVKTFTKGERSVFTKISYAWMPN